ncbi:MAG: DUF2007 domain-containing protein [Acidobacteriota bacterium]|nr:DUF2007 domain-containing protein [Acidobacteriota bacterium]
MSREHDAKSSEPVVLTTFMNRIEAELVAGKLRDAGIETVLRSDDAGGMEPNLALVRGVWLLVRRRDLERARELLETEPGLLDSDAEAGGDRGES